MNHVILSLVVKETKGINNMGKMLDFFDPAVQKIIRADGCPVYHMKNATGEGVITQYSILPGVELFYNDIHMVDGENENKQPFPNVLEINHCREGRFECVCSSGGYMYLGAGDLAINRLANQTVSTGFPLGHYHGISITLDMPLVAMTLKQIEEVIGELHIDIYGIAEKFCGNGKCNVLRSRKEIAHIFSELYCAQPQMMSYYLKIKVVELLMYLNAADISEYHRKERYFSGSQVKKVKEMQRYMISDLRRHDTLHELAHKFDLSLTTMKSCFREVYGSSVQAYMQAYRVQAATVFLRDTDKNITQIALEMGYDNPSKFSEVFKKKTGYTPSDYRKKMSKRSENGLLRVEDHL